MAQIVMKIDVCSICKKTKAEYLWYRSSVFSDVIIKFLCPKCFELIDELK